MPAGNQVLLFSRDKTRPCWTRALDLPLSTFDPGLPADCQVAARDRIKFLLLSLTHRGKDPRVQSEERAARGLTRDYALALV